MNLSKKLDVAIVGANGYSGIELARILLKHPHAELKACFVRDSSWKLSNEFSGREHWLEQKAATVASLNIKELIPCAHQFHTIFLATPIEVSLELVPLLSSKAKVIDLSGAFRLNHELNVQVDYGLMPWRTQNKDTAVLSNPGCYATSCLMALIPLLKSRLINEKQIVIDAKSGTTGAGRKAQENLLFSEVEGECLPYRVGQHQHLPEVKKYADLFGEADIDLQMVTHLLPVRRGIISSLYLKRSSKFSSESDIDFLTRVNISYKNAYEGSPLVRFGSLENNPKLLSLKSVVGSPRTHISYTVKADKIFVFSSIDNLLKGAASQAVENWNFQNSWSGAAGIELIEGIL